MGFGRLETGLVCNLNTYYRPVKQISPDLNTACITVCKCVTVIIKTTHCLHLVAQLIESVHKFYPGTPIIVLDEYDTSSSPSSSEEWDEIKQESFQSNITYVRTYQAAYYSRTVAVQAATTRYILVLDDNTILTEDTDLRYLLRVLESTDLTIAAGHVRDDQSYEGVFRVFQTGIGPTAQASLIFYPDVFYEHLWPVADCYAADAVQDFFLAKRQAILEGDSWDVSLMTFEHEDFILNMRMRRLKMAYCPKVTISRNVCERTVKNTVTDPGDIWYEILKDKWGFNAMFVCDKNEYVTNFHCNSRVPYGKSHNGLVVLVYIVVSTVVILTGRAIILWIFWCTRQKFNTLRSRQNGRHFPDDIL